MWVAKAAAAILIPTLGALVSIQWSAVVGVAGGVAAFMTVFPCHNLTITVDYFSPRHKDKLDDG